MVTPISLRPVSSVTFIELSVWIPVRSGWKYVQLISFIISLQFPPVSAFPPNARNELRNSFCPQQKVILVCSLSGCSLTALFKTQLKTHIVLHTIYRTYLRQIELFTIIAQEGKVFPSAQICSLSLMHCLVLHFKRLLNYKIFINIFLFFSRGWNVLYFHCAHWNKSLSHFAEIHFLQSYQRGPWRLRNEAESVPLQI